MLLLIGKKKHLQDFYLLIGRQCRAVRCEIKRKMNVAKRKFQTIRKEGNYLGKNIQSSN